MIDKRTHRLLDALSDLDDATLDAARPSIADSATDITDPLPRAAKTPGRKKWPISRRGMRRIIALAASIALVFAIALYLFIPVEDAPRIAKYEDDEYYPLISAIANFYYEKTGYRNNFDRLLDGILDMFLARGGSDISPTPPADFGSAGSAPGGEVPEGSSQNGSYVEVTDNQVADVIESDIMKATDKYIFRLASRVAYNNNLYLRVYSVAGEATALVSELELSLESDNGIVIANATEMYLSADATRVTLVERYHDNDYNFHTLIRAVDVSDVQNMSVVGEVVISGNYTDSRMVGDLLLVVGNYTPKRASIDYGDPTTFVPHVTDKNGTHPVGMENVLLPEELSDMGCSVVTLIDTTSLEAVDSAALYNFTDTLYTTAESIYLVNSFSKEKITDEGISYGFVAYSEIARLSWSEDGIDLCGRVTVEGDVKDQYSLDERDGHLRVVTTTTTTFDEDGEYVHDFDASLFILNIDGMTIRTSVEYFAPTGERAMSVRFDGDRLYVCTALVIDPVTFCDPVYFFDLGDYDNITATDTGDIDGYSSSLIQYPNGILLGVGEVDGFDKLEIYREEDGKVISVDKHVFDGLVSSEYKSYFIDREHSLIGMDIIDYSEIDPELGVPEGAGKHIYAVFSLAGDDITLVSALPMNAGYSLNRTRAVAIGDYLYITNENGIFTINLFGGSD